MVKRGFFFWVEMVFLIIIITIAVLSMPKSQDNFLKSKDSENLENLGFSALQNLDRSHVLETFVNPTNFASSNFTALSVYIRKSLPSTIETTIEYAVGDACRDESGSLLSSCGNITMPADTVVMNYAFTRAGSPVTIKLYLRGIFS